MNEQQLSQLEFYAPEIPTVSVDDFSDRNKTLLYGYDCDRNTLHVYIMDDEIHILWYRGSEMLGYSKNTSFYLEELCPNKRAHPQHTDFTLAKMFRMAEVDCTYTTVHWHKVPNETPQFAGKIREDFN